MKKYRLKKDLPGVKKGAIFRKGEDDGWLIYQRDRYLSSEFPSEVYQFSEGMMQDTDWFEEVEEEKTQEEGNCMKGFRAMVRRDIKSGESHKWAYIAMSLLDTDSPSNPFTIDGHIVSRIISEEIATHREEFAGPIVERYLELNKKTKQKGKKKE